MLKDKTALITGASRGIGRAIALAMAAAGANIAVVFAGNQAAASGVQTEITALGRDCALYCCDVSDFQAVKSLVEQVITRFGSLDILVNNAGIVRDGLLMTMKEEDFDAVIDTNLKGAFNLIRHTAPHFLRKKCGRIINISSVTGISGNAGQTNYSAAKAGMIGLTKSTAKELGSRGITCNALAPGFIETDMTQALSDEVKAAALTHIPLKRLGRPEDIAAMAVFLASDSASYITGEVIKIDGGMCM